MAAPIVPAAQVSGVVLRAAAVPTIVVGVAAVVIAGILGGGGGALGAAIAAVLVIAFFGLGLYVLGRILEQHPSVMLSAALALYLAQILVLFAFIAVFKDTTLFDPKAFGLTVVACTVVWLVAQVWAMSHTRMLYVEPVPAATGTNEDGDRT